MRNERNQWAAKVELGKLAIESVTQVLTLAMTNADKANERLHQSLTSERPDAVVKIAERELDLAENLMSKAFDMMERAIAAQEKRAEAHMQSVMNKAARFSTTAFQEGYQAAMENMEEENRTTTEDEEYFRADRNWAQAEDA